MITVNEPQCIGCGSRPQECYESCGGRDGGEEWRGYCNKCDSLSGRRGACCMPDTEGDPEECKRVPGESYKYRDWHTCVLVPGRLSNIAYSRPHGKYTNNL